MKDEGRESGGLDLTMTGAATAVRWGRRSPYGYPRHEGAQAGNGRSGPTYAALDLGTNNCRLLVCACHRRQLPRGRRFSRIIRLGEGVFLVGRISDAAIARAVEALAILPRQDEEPRGDAGAADRDRGVSGGEERRRVPRPHRRRGRARARDHRSRDRGRSGGRRLHAADRSAGGRRDPVRHRRRLLGAGPLEQSSPTRRGPPLPKIKGWVSLRSAWSRWPSVMVGMWSRRDLLGDDRGGRGPHRIASWPSTAARDGSRPPARHLGHGTTIAGVHLELRRYERRRVDGCWMGDDEVTR